MKKTLLKLAISCVLLGLLLWRVPLHAVGSHMASFTPVTLAVAVGISLVCCGLAAARLWCLLPEFRYGELLHLTFVSRFYSTVLPGQIAGDVVKAYRLGQHTTLAGHAEAATALDRVIGLFALFLISAIASIHAVRVPVPLRAFFIAGTIGMVVGGALTSSRWFREAVLEPLLGRRRGRIGTFVHDFSIALNDHLRRPRRLILAMVPALAFHVGSVVMQVMLGNDLGMQLGWSDWTIVYAGVSLLMLLPISVAGLGLREGGYVGLLALFQYKASIALSLSFAIFGVLLVAMLAGGGLELVGMLNRPKPASKSENHSTD